MMELFFLPRELFTGVTSLVQLNVMREIHARCSPLTRSMKTKLLIFLEPVTMLRRRLLLHVRRLAQNYRLGEKNFAHAR